MRDGSDGKKKKRERGGRLRTQKRKERKGFGLTPNAIANFLGRTGKGSSVKAQHKEI